VLRLSTQLINSRVSRPGFLLGFIVLTFLLIGNATVSITTQFVETAKVFPQIMGMTDAVALFFQFAVMQTVNLRESYHKHSLPRSATNPLS
jgi:hypothetical protein